MGFLTRNLDKPGKGVEKEEVEKSSSSSYITTFTRRFGKFVQLNLAFMIPTALILFLCVAVYFAPYYLGMQYFPMVKFGSAELNLYDTYVTYLPLILLSIPYSGAMVVARRLANGDYAFVWNEFAKGVKENWKPFLINGVVCYVFYVMASFAFMFYLSSVKDNWLFYIPLVFVVIVAVVFIMTQFYVPVMIVSVNIKLRHVYKNSLILCAAGILKNILFIVIAGIIIAFYIMFVPIMNGTLLIGIILLIVIVPSFLMYSQAFVFYPVVDLLVIQPYNKKKEEEEGPPPPSKPSLTDYEGIEENNSTYVYKDGKLVRIDEEEK